eukprot:COSAG06_NODE_26141_length_620_cov_3.700576_1_plen_99_part_01
MKGKGNESKSSLTDDHTLEAFCDARGGGPGRRRHVSARGGATVGLRRRGAQAAVVKNVLLVSDPSGSNHNEGGMGPEMVWAAATNATQGGGTRSRRRRR